MIVFIRRKKKTTHFIAYFLKDISKVNNSYLADCRQPTCHSVTLGLVLAKKKINSSVNRNLIKRWIREQVRELTRVKSIVVRVYKPFDLITREDKLVIFHEIRNLFREISDQ